MDRWREGAARSVSEGETLKRDAAVKNGSHFTNYFQQIYRQIVIGQRNCGAFVARPIGHTHYKAFTLNWSQLVDITLRSRFGDNCAQLCIIGIN